MLLELETKMTDVCMSAVVKKAGSESAYNAHKFSDILNLPQFNHIREIAFEIYSLMTMEAQFCPTVDQHDLYGVSITWRSLESHPDGYDRFTTITIDNGVALHYRWGRRGSTAPNRELYNVSKLQQFIKKLSLYLDWQAESVDICKGK